MAPDAQQAFYEANGVLNIVTDIFIYLTPIPMLWDVQINLVSKIPVPALVLRFYYMDLTMKLQRKKIALFAVFGLGVLSIAGKFEALQCFEYVNFLANLHLAGCVRYDYVRMLATTSDQYYALADALNWCGIEVYIGEFLGRESASRSH
jgi:hypothetical protein